MRRRDFVAGFTRLAAAWPLAAGAQQPMMPVVGFLDPASFDYSNADRLRAFRQGLKDTGYVEGENVAIDYRWAEGQVDRLPLLAAELVRRQVAVIAALASAVFPAKAATTTIPIVFISAEDPVKLGLVASLARPGGNLTGFNIFNDEVAAKRLELLRELVPGATRVAVLVDPTNGLGSESILRDVEAAARAMGLQIRVIEASSSSEINAAFATFVSERPDALYVGGGPFFNTRRIQLAILAARHLVPMTSSARAIAEVGGLMSYGSDVLDTIRQVGVYTGRILKGAKPADLPVVQASKFALVINLQTAKALGVTVPPTLLARADEVIE